MIDRRELVLGALALLGCPRIAGAQAPAKAFRIGILAGTGPTSPEARHLWQEFFEELRDLGYVEGGNLLVEGRYYGDRIDRLPGFAAELARLQMDVIVAGAPPAPEAARRATTTIPIVMANHSDPVASGLVASFARPGGNVTGLSLRSLDIRVKWLQLLREILPSLSLVAVLRHPTIQIYASELETAARSLKMQVQIVDVRAPGELAAAVAAAARERAGALLVTGGSMFFAHRIRLAELALKHRLPSVYLLREHVEAGGLLAYGADLRDSFRRAAGYVDRILRGAKPGELPIEQPSKFELTINLKTARALGLTVPPSVLARADRIVD